MPQDLAKAIELWLRAGELGCADAYFKLGNSYDFGRGADTDKKKANHFYELAAMNGDVGARHNLGCLEGEVGNNHRTIKHFILAAGAGHKKSLDAVKRLHEWYCDKRRIRKHFTCLSKDSRRNEK